MINVQAGRLRNKVTVRRYTEQKDIMGGITKVWTTFAVFRAFLDGSAGKEKYVSAELHADSQYYLEFRYLPGLKESDNLLIDDDSKVLDITSIVNVENKNTWHRVLAKKAAKDDAMP